VPAGNYPSPEGETVSDLIPLEAIASRIYLIRDLKVMLDSDLAELYDVPTRRLNEQVKRNLNRFPKDFMFQLTWEEYENLRSQFATSSNDSSHGGRRHAPLVFTEHGALMAASVLKSKRAVEVSIYVVRAFVQLRQMLATHEDLKRKIEAMEAKYDEQFQVVFEAIRQLLETDAKPKRKIGF
jgi:hypothetical protein